MKSGTSKPIQTLQEATREKPFTQSMASKELSLTVLVPTANRPVFLRTTIESIALQSARSRINRVIVSENGDCKESKQVVEEFKHLLPIEWIFQANRLSPQQHGIWLSKQVETAYMAQVADDDIWDKYHIEEALHQLSRHPNAAAYFGRAVDITTKGCQPVSPFSITFDEITDPILEDSQLKDVVIWSARDVAINSMVSTPLNIWSLVAKTEIHQIALAESTGHPVLGNFPANDSFYIWRLACHGDLLIGRHISLFYRLHADSDIHRCLRERPLQTLNEDLQIRGEILDQALRLGIDSRKLFKSRFQKCLDLGESMITIQSQQHLDWILEIKPRPKRTGPEHVKRFIVDLMPPLVTRLIVFMLNQTGLRRPSQ